MANLLHHATVPNNPAIMFDTPSKSLQSFAAPLGFEKHEGRVLVVDDDAPIRMAIVQSLRKIGYEVEEAVDGESALTKVRILDPDVVLLDVGMPGIDGFEVCRFLREDPSTRMIPIIILTGQSSRSARLRGLDAGASDIVTKPFDIVELGLRVRNHVAFRRLIKDLDSAEQIVFSIALAVEARDKDTGGHCERLAALGVMLGEVLELDNDDVIALRRAGFLHDIGKIGVPDSILLKPGKLNDEEWMVMRQHPVMGYEICMPLRTLRPVLPVIRHHHERFDGTGYPDGLKGEQIPRLARIFQVADVFDALTNERSYRKALSHENAISILREEADKGWWDPQYVEVLARLVFAENSFS